MNALRAVEPARRRPTRHVIVVRERCGPLVWRSETPALDWIVWHRRALARIGVLILAVAIALSFVTCAVVDVRPFFVGWR